jgi:hypothetical protein
MSESEFDTIDKVAKDIFKHLDEDALMKISNPNLHGDGFIGKTTMLSFEGAIKRWIRNMYGLWSISPLTKKWRTKEDSREIVNGIDYSKDHPDNISEVIFLRVKELYENGYSWKSNNP